MKKKIAAVAIATGLAVAMLAAPAHAFKDTSWGKAKMKDTSWGKVHFKDTSWG